MAAIFQVSNRDTKEIMKLAAMGLAFGESDFKSNKKR
jgi:hypothetical protein